MRKNILASFVAGLFIVTGFAASPVSALTLSDLQSQLSSLLSQIAALQSQQGGTGITGSDTISNAFTTPTSYRICALLNRNFGFGSRGDDVSALQEFLHGQGYLDANATGFFGLLTSSALAHWQTSQGLTSAGAVGPLTRARLALWCGNPTPVCKPITYMPIACSDGAAAHPVHDANGCITGYECAVANYVPPANCKAWNDGCNDCTRATTGGTASCTTRQCFAAGKGYCSSYFSQTTNTPPSVSSFSGPTTLSVNQSGSWSVQASDPANGSLSYHVTWGDENAYPVYTMNAGATLDAFVQTTTFTHAYSTAGTYTVTITVKNQSGQQASASATVKVGSSIDIICTAEYAPVCAQPPEPACRHSIPACMIATPGPQTYSNRCVASAAGATFLYMGQCAITVACTADAQLCPDGSYVGRTGANCQFVCPTTNTTGASCTTPYGSLTVASGQTVSDQPYFSNGYYTGSMVVGTHRCSNGTWLAQ
jgi:PKD repeat protein